MFLFIMDMGRILLIEQFITERTRATVRSAVVNNWTAAATQNYLVYNSTTAPGGGGPGFLGLQTSNVTYQTLGTSGNPRLYAASEGFRRPGSYLDSLHLKNLYSRAHHSGYAGAEPGRYQLTLFLRAAWVLSWA